ncbi:MAG TPA: amidase [Solirubrobacteraceae bacterium]|nr:amidase [Solirubrobacteraceae bacterium]
MRSAAEIARAVGAGELDPVAVVEEALAAIEEHRDLNAVLTVCGTEARARARGGVSGRLAGVPLLVKDLIDVAGTRTTFGSKIYADRVAETSAPCVRALEAEGAIVIAKTNCDEFAWGVCGQNVHWGDTQNPRHPGRIASGSSSGNAAALAVGIGALALGTDTGGSVRLPAAACGVVGMKPELGAISTEGVFPLARSFDTVGPMARSVEDCALAWSILTGRAVPAPSLDAKTVGVLARHPSLGRPEAEGPDPRAAALGDTEVELPVPAADIWAVFSADAADSHQETFPARAADYGPIIRAKLEHAIAIEPEVVAAARDALRAWREAAAIVPLPDVIVSPTLGLAELPAIETHEEEYRVPLSAYARAFSFLGWPAIAIGETQLAARDARTLYEAALAWG